MSRALKPVSKEDGDFLCESVLRLLKLIAEGVGATSTRESTGVAVAPEMADYVNKRSDNRKPEAA